MLGMCVRAWACACVRVALLIRHATTAILTFAARVPPTNLSTPSLKQYDFGEKLLNIKTCVLIFSATLFERFLILRRIKKDIVIQVKMSLCKEPVILVGF
jgi:hypothetical protein